MVNRYLNCSCPVAVRAHHPRAAGFSLLVVLGMVAAMGVGLSFVGIAWQTRSAREAEAELLWVGRAYQEAIRRYQMQKLRYPVRIEDLLQDPNSAVPRRYIRKLYRDPTSKPNAATLTWQLLILDGHIVGIASATDQKPFKTGDFEWLNRSFQEKNSYRDWRFTYPPELAIDPRVQSVPWTENGLGVASGG